jgi:hypothetical protein
MKTKLIALVVMLSLSFTAFAQKKDATQSNATFTPEYWEVKINFDLPALEPEAIQIACLSREPIELFNATFSSAFLIEQLKTAKDEKEKNMYINVQIEVTWDQLFSVVKGSELYLLTKKGMIFSQSGDCSKEKDKKWLTSKVFYLDGKPYCFVAPLKVENGAKIEVTLNSSNMIPLTELYEKIKK